MSFSRHRRMNYHREHSPVVIDNGSGKMKAGFAGACEPEQIISTVVAHPARYVRVMVGLGDKVSHVGDEAHCHRGILKLNYPIERGVIVDWAKMEEIWHYLFYNLLHVAPEEHPILMTEAPFNMTSNREKMAQIMFESPKFNVSSFYVSNQASLALYSQGRGTGVVVDSGDGVTCVSPIYEGYLIPPAVEKMDLAGRDITNYLMRLLTEQGCYFNTTGEREIVRDIKEKLCYVAPDDFEREMLAWPCLLDRTTQQYELPDGQIIDLGSERFRCTEAMFRPALVGKESLGIHELVYNAIMKSGIDTRAQLWQNIVLSGGNTMFPGFSERLQNELERLAPRGTKVRVLAAADRKYSTWIGGSILASFACFQPQFITRQEYDETGPSVVHKRCIFR